jgi:hypothetical protein
MRSAIKKQLVKNFAENIENNFPDFLQQKFLDSALYLWRRTIATDLFFLLGLQIFRDKDVFVLEIGWSEDGEFHFDSYPPFDVEKSFWRNRLTKFIKKPRSEVWDLTPEFTAAREAYIDALDADEPLARPEPPDPEVVIPRIPALVDDALNKFKQYAFPLFNKVARHRGFETPFDEG